MPKRKKIDPSQYISIAQVEDKALAQDCQRLLRDNEIDAKVVEAKKQTCIIKVQEGRFNEAYMIIHAHLSADGFFDIHKDTPQQTITPNHAA